MDTNTTVTLSPAALKALKASMDRMIADGTMTPEDAIVHTAPGTPKEPSDTQVITQTLITQHEHQLYPHKRDQQVATDFWNNLETDEEHYKKVFHGKVKSGTVTPMLSIVCYYLLYATKPMDHTLLLHLLLDCDDSERVAFYNWDIASHFSATNMTRFGPYIQKMTVPMIPGEQYMYANAELLDKLKESLSKSAYVGGSAQEPYYAGVYRKEPHFLEGGGYNEAVYNAQGEQVYAINMDNTEARLLELQKSIETMKRQVTSQYHHPRGGRGGHYQTHGPHSQAYRSQTYHRGRGRGNGYYGGGEENQEPQVHTAQTAPKN